METNHLGICSRHNATRRCIYFHKIKQYITKVKNATMGPFDEQFFKRDSNSMEIVFCFLPSSSKVISMKL